MKGRRTLISYRTAICISDSHRECHYLDIPARAYALIPNPEDKKRRQSTQRINDSQRV
jgi:hypothetical protein